MREINDFGPIYAETNLDLLIAEPFNTFSNLIFLVIIIYWARKTKFHFKDYPLIVFCLPILFIGFVGGTIFHATRSHSIWLILDFVPIMILTITAAVRFWQMVTNSKVWGTICPLAIILLTRTFAQVFNLPRNFQISFGYLGLSTAILLPAFIYSYKNDFLGLKQLLLSICFIIIALIFRASDLALATYLPMGSHFLWHIFGALSVHYLISFIYITKTQINNNPED